MKNQAALVLFLAVIYVAGPVSGQDINMSRAEVRMLGGWSMPVGSNAIQTTTGEDETISLFDGIQDNVTFIAEASRHMRGGFSLVFGLDYFVDEQDTVSSFLIIEPALGADSINEFSLNRILETSMVAPYLAGRYRAARGPVAFFGTAGIGFALLDAELQAVFTGEGGFRYDAVYSFSGESILLHAGGGVDWLVAGPLVISGEVRYSHASATVKDGGRRQAVGLPADIPWEFELDLSRMSFLAGVTVQF